MQTPSSSRRFFSLSLASLIATVLAAAAGILATYFLWGVEHLFALLADQPRWIPLLAMTLGGGLAGFLWWLIRRKPLPDINDAVENRSDVYPVGRTTLDAALQLAVVGMGASIGREAAPRQLAGVLTHRMGLWFKLLPADRSVVVASAAGAALGAVYNTPLAGIAYTLCVLLSAFSWLALAVATVTSVGGVLLARLALGSQAFYDFPTVNVDSRVWIWVAVAIPLVALCGWIFRVGARYAKDKTINSAFLPLTVALALGITGLIGLVEPNLAGNGVLILDGGFSHTIGISGFLLLIALKPLITFFTIRLGARGGVLTPALAMGACLGGVAALIVDQKELVPLFMMVGAAALLAVSENSIVFGVLFSLELIHAPFPLWPAVMTASVGSVVLVRLGEKRLIKPASRQSS